MEPIALIDAFPEDPDEVLAVKYMWSKLDDQIEQAGQDWKEGPSPPRLQELIEFRYGTLPALEKSRRQKTLDVVKVAVARTREPIVQGMSAYALSWSNERAGRAVRWFQGHLEQRWPPGIAFLAEDLPTLHAACLAMDIAALRDKPVADDPFPAPPVLITGPTGTGKELLAKAIHLRSGLEPEPWDINQPRLFGALNCGGLPTDLLESELFGHVKGAFTGASTNKPGFVAQYAKGTLFLDEIGDMPPEVQVRLLRFLNNGDFRPVGSNEITRATPRIISATHVNLEEKVAQKEFREDLFFRVRGRRIRLRGLRERHRQSVLALIQRFLEQEARRRDRTVPVLTRQAWVALLAHDWPGNMRELRYIVERLIDEARPRRVLDLDELDPEIALRYRHVIPAHQQDVLAAMAEEDRGDTTRSAFVLVQRLEARYAEQQRREDTRAATLRRAAELVGRLAGNVRLDQQVAVHVDALRLASEEALIQEFRKTWLLPMKDYAAASTFNVERATQLLEKRLDEEGSEVKSKLDALQTRVAEASNAYAVSNLAAILMRIAETGAIPQVRKLLEVLESATEMAQAPPLDEGFRLLFEKLKILTPAQLKDEVKAFFARDASQVPEGEESVPLSWDDVKENPAALEAIIAEAGTVRAAASALGVSAETVSRTRNRRRVNPG
ncbi:sigma 54-interacting transcriptional regulator [Sorangium sp. So ce1036]|uniref:sigma 54-interacting transcriptional regulator n=1 Tax=Sorangium sp. So ce1036 TaxID=3133328 RepID=UPI003F0623E0